MSEGTAARFFEPFEATVSGEMRERIMDALANIENGHGISVVFAVESGSRAWGFPSPDSDYDVRFVYARPVEWYLSIHPGRDVIELPIDDELDISGWDIRKAIGLLLKPNPVLPEWLSSPIRYRWNGRICSRLTAFSSRVAHHSACHYHYKHLAESQWRRHISDRKEVEYKKYFYALGPALSLRWVRMMPGHAPPMNLQELVSGLELDSSTVAAIDRLLEIKRTACETGTGERIAPIDRLIEDELQRAGDQSRGREGRTWQMTPTRCSALL